MFPCASGKGRYDAYSRIPIILMIAKLFCLLSLLCLCKGMTGEAGGSPIRATDPPSTIHGILYEYE
jgi:hypothetical protein